MSKLGDYANYVLTIVFIGILVLSLIAGAIQQRKGEELSKTPLMPLLVILWAGYVFAFFVVVVGGATLSVVRWLAS